MSPEQRREQVRLEILTSKMHLAWAIAQQKSNPTTPALERFIKDCREECRSLKVELARVNREVKLKKLFKDTKI